MLFSPLVVIKVNSLAFSLIVVTLTIFRMKIQLDDLIVTFIKHYHVGSHSLMGNDFVILHLFHNLYGKCRVSHLLNPYKLSLLEIVMQFLVLNNSKTIAQ